MTDVRFEWDDRKEAANRRKHRIPFEEAATAFSDERALFMDDPDHSAAEERYLLLGMSASVRLLVVSFCFRARDEVIRIISARRTTRREQETYGRRWKR